MQGHALWQVVGSHMISLPGSHAADLIISCHFPGTSVDDCGLCALMSYKNTGL